MDLECIPLLGLAVNAANVGSGGASVNVPAGSIGTIAMYDSITSLD